MNRPKVGYDRRANTILLQEKDVVNRYYIMGREIARASWIAVRWEAEDVERICNLASQHRETYVRFGRGK